MSHTPNRPAREGEKIFTKDLHAKEDNVTEEKKANHQAKIIRIEDTRAHTNADTLELISIGDYQVVVKKGEFKAGDLAVYIQPDSVVPQTEPFRFIWETYVGLDGTVPEKRRRITVRKFRKEWSEGLLLPVFIFPDLLFGEKGVYLSEGDEVSDILGITHYAPPEPTEIGPLQRKQQYKWPPRSIKGFFYYLLNLIGIDMNKGTGGLTVKGPKNPPPIYDVDSLRHYRDAFVPGEYVTITEKIHGSNARYTYVDGTFYVGSRTQWKSPKSDTVWHKAAAQDTAIELWCREHEGWTLYGEVVPTQGGFSYGAKEGRVDFYAFDVLSPLGIWNDPHEWDLRGINTVPVISRTSFDLDEVKKLVDGPSLVPGAKHIREGIVITPEKERHIRGLGRLKLKLVSNAFLEKDSK